MYYHLHRQGENLGVFTLEELRSRRDSGELLGTEYIWREGMPDWAPIDSILQQTAPPLPRSAPPPLPQSPVKGKSGRTVLWVALAVFLFLAIVTVVGIVGTKVGKRFLPALDTATGDTGQEAVDVAKQPISWTSNTLTEADVQKRSAEFRTRQWLEGYQQRSRRDAPCDSEAIKFLETWIARNYRGDVPANLPSNNHWAEKLAAMPGCDDPLLLTIVAINSAASRDRASRLDRAVNGFQNSKHKAYPKLYATIMLADDLNTQAGQRQSLQLSAVELFRQSLTDGGLRTGDQAELGEILINGWGDNFFRQHHDAICQAAGDGGKSFQWLALVLKGEAHIIEAWKARGGGYVNTVSDEGWKGFNTHLASARESLSKAWKLRPEWPLAAERMIYVSLGDSGIEEMRKWFDRAVAAQIDYPRAWSGLRWGLRPRWHGDAESMLALGVAAVNTKRFDTDVPRKLFDVVTDLEAEDDELGPGEHLYGRENIWPHVQAMYEGYIAEPSQSTARDGWRGIYSAVAFLAEKYDVSRKQLEALDWKPQPWNLGGWGADLSLMPLEVAARTGQSGARITEAESARRRGELAQAVLLYTNLVAARNLDERTSEFARHRLATLRIEQRLQSGDWVNLLPARENDLAWNVVLGKTERLPDGALEIEPGTDGHFLTSRARVGSSFEIKGEFEVVHAPSGDFEAGLTIGLPDLNGRQWNALLMGRTQGRDTARLSGVWNIRRTSRQIQLNKDRNSFHLRLQGGRIAASVNGQEIFSGMKPPQTLGVRADDFLVGLAAPGEHEAVLRYRSLQARKLPVIEEAAEE